MSNWPPPNIQTNASHWRLPIAILFVLSTSFWNCESGIKSEHERPSRPNILFIAVDDLRPELGCYGVDYIQSPHIDALAADGLLFKNHYVQVPTCGASRYALLTGMYPRHTNHLSNRVIVDSLAEKQERSRPESFVHHLRRNGYRTVGMGKISHMPDGFVYGYQEPVSNIMEMPHSWDEFLFDAGKWKTGHNAFFGYADGSNRNDLDKQVPPYEAADVEDNGYPDGMIADMAMEKLNILDKQDNPFFLAIGFFKPHLPFNAPQKYWDLYDRDEIPLTSFPNIPDQVHPSSLHNSGEFNQYALGEEKAGLDHDLSTAYARKLKHAYAACVSYVDAQIGKVIKSLKDNDLYDHTIIVLWGDHGWHLGDYRVWGKHTLFEQSLSSALIIKAPNAEKKGIVVNSPVASIDLYPTILDLCMIPMPHTTDGQSLRPMISNPEMGRKDPVYSFFRRGVSARTDQYRITKYFREEEPTIELYDLSKNPIISRNIAKSNPEVVNQLFDAVRPNLTNIYNQ